MSGKVLVIAGPTASGKTALACRLFDNYPLDLISVDATQIYRGLNIGSAKPDSDFLARYPHALIDILDPEASYSAAKFCTDATALIAKSHAKQRIPVLVGGTMLYYHALFAGLSDLPSSTPEMRAVITAEIESKGLTALYAELQAQDPATAAKISAHDRQRITRFTELMRLTGKTPSALFAEQAKSRPAWDTLAIGLVPERNVLHQLIAARFHDMLQRGFLEEVRALRERPNLTANHPAMRSVGYRQLWAHLDGKTTLAEATELGIIATRQLAKRQITWLRNRLQEAFPVSIYDPLNAASAAQIDARLRQWISSEKP